MRWIYKDNILNSILQDSNENGNYDINGNLIKTGDNEQYQIKNIYDMAGNVCEWTMESFGITQKVQRGGKSGTTDAISFREAENTNIKSALCGFRIALYVK